MPHPHPTLRPLPALPIEAVAAHLRAAIPDGALALRAWAEHHRILAGTDLIALEHHAAALLAAVDADDPAASVARWISAPPDLAGRHDRRATARIAGLVIDSYAGPFAPDWAAVDVAPLTTSRRRPLRALELGACRTVITLDDERARWATIFGLTEATAGAMERPQIRRCNLDLAARRVELPGTPGRTAARTGRLTRWAAPHIADHVAALDTQERPPHAPVVYDGRYPPGHPKTPQSTTNVLRAVLDRAGLRAPDVQPESIRNTLPAAAFNGDNALHIQRLLGCASVDQALREIGIWRHPAARRRPSRRPVSV